MTSLFHFIKKIAATNRTQLCFSPTIQAQNIQKKFEISKCVAAVHLHCTSSQKVHVSIVACVLTFQHVIHIGIFWQQSNVQQLHCHLKRFIVFRFEGLNATKVFTSYCLFGYIVNDLHIRYHLIGLFQLSLSKEWIICVGKRSNFNYVYISYIYRVSSLN